MAIHWDRALHQAANKSLDLTIELANPDKAQILKEYRGRSRMKGLAPKGPNTVSIDVVVVADDGTITSAALAVVDIVTSSVMAALF